MKGALVAILALVTTVASATSIKPAIKTEKLSVSKIDSFLNLMPPVRPGIRPVSLLTTNVISSGCTTGRHFQVSVVPSEGTQYVSIKRIKLDTCKGLQRRTNVKVRTTLINPKLPVVVLNPVPLDYKEVH